jgi:WD40 repeat protein
MVFIIVSISIISNIAESGNDDLKNVIKKPIDVSDFIRLKMEGYGTISQIEYSPDGTELAVSSYNGGLFFFNTQNFSLDRKFVYHNISIRDFDWSPDGTEIVLASYDKIVILDAKTGGKTSIFETKVKMEIINWSPDGSKVGASGLWGLHVYNLSNNKILFKNKDVYSFAWSPDGKNIAVHSEWNISIHNSTTGAHVKTLHGKMQTSNTMFSDNTEILWSPDGSKIFNELWHYGLKPRWNNYEFQVLDVDSGKLIGRPQEISSHMRTHSWSSDSTFIFEMANPIVFYDSNNISVVRTLKPTTPDTYFCGGKISWSPDGKFIAMASSNGCIQVVDSITGEINQIAESPGFIEETTLSPDNTQIAALYFYSDRSSEYHSRIRIINPQNTQLINSFEFPEKIYALKWSPKGQTLVFCTSNLTKIMDASNGEILQILKHPGAKNVRHLAWSPSGNRLATCAGNNITRIWDAKSWQIIKEFHNSFSIYSVAWHPDETKLATGLFNGTLEVWDVVNGKLIKKQTENELRLDDNGISAVAWSPDGSRFAFAFEFKVRVYNDTNGFFIRQFDQGALKLGCGLSSDVIRWSPDGSKLAIRGCYPIVWDCETGEAKILRAPSDTAPDIFSFDWLSDGKGIVTGHRSGTIGLWGSPADVSIVQSEILVSKNDPEVGKNVKIKFTIENSGTLNASNFAVRIYDGTKQIDEQKIGFLERSGGRLEISSELEARKDTHKIIVKIDPYDDIPEFNETNNLANKTLSVKEPFQLELSPTDLCRIIILIIFIIIIIRIFMKSRKKK